MYVFYNFTQVLDSFTHFICFIFQIWIYNRGIILNTIILAAPLYTLIIIYQFIYCVVQINIVFIFVPIKIFFNHIFNKNVRIINLSLNLIRIWCLTKLYILVFKIANFTRFQNTRSICVWIPWEKTTWDNKLPRNIIVFWFLFNKVSISLCLNACNNILKNDLRFIRARERWNPTIFNCIIVCFKQVFTWAIYIWKVSRFSAAVH